MAAKRRVRAKPIRVRGIYFLVQDAVERGIGFGLNRAIKHEDKDLKKDEDFEAVRAAVLQAVTTELCELLEFPVDE